MLSIDHNTNKGYGQLNEWFNAHQWEYFWGIMLYKKTHFTTCVVHFNRITHTIHTIVTYMLLHVNLRYSAAASDFSVHVYPRAVACILQSLAEKILLMWSLYSEKC